MKVQDLYLEINNYEYISFDIFDTLLLRPFVIPGDLFEYIEDKYGASGFARARKSVIVKGVAEKSIDDIYRVIPQKYKKYYEIELKEEANTIYPNQHIKELFDYAINKNKTVVITSDIYFHFDYLNTILQKNNIKGFKKIYSSCDYQQTKNKGDLFITILNDLGIEGKDLLHIGDNVISDNAIPRALGIKTALIPKHFEEYKKYRPYLEKPPMCSFQISFINKICADNYVNSEYQYSLSKEDYCWYRFGHDIAGPTCWAMTKWIQTVVARDGEYSDLVFVARDGYLLKKMFDIMSISGVQTHYLYAPRVLSVFLQNTYINNRDRQTISNSEYETVSKAFFLDDKKSSNPDQIVKDTAQAYKAYLNDKKFGNGKIGIVDSTTDNLSSQKLISNMLGVSKVSGLYWYASQNAVMHDYEIDTFQNEHYIIIKSPSLFELIFKSPEPPVKCFSANGSVEFYEPIDNEKYRIEKFNYIEKGALDFFRSAIDKKVVFEIDANTMNHYLIEYCEQAPLEERKIIESMPSSGGIANNLWTPTRVFIGKKKKYHLAAIKGIKDEIKMILSRYPNCYYHFRNVYRLLQHCFEKE